MSDNLIKTKYSFLFEKKTYNAKLHKDVWSHVFVVSSKISDLYVRGKELYAIYNYETHFWTQVWNEAVELIDQAGYEAVEEHVGKHIMEDPEYAPIVLRMANTDNNLIDKFTKFVRGALGDNWKPLNQKVLFSNSVIKREDRATGTLSYPLQEMPTPFYDKFKSRVYVDEALKYEWMVGAIIAGEQRKIQKIGIFFGPPGCGKTTVLENIIVDTIFGGPFGLYCAEFSPEELAARTQFAAAWLSRDPVVAFQNEADLSRIETNTLFNTICSHEPTKVNDKFQRTYIVIPNCLCFVCTNDPIQLSSTSGLNRRLLDIRPTGDLLSPDEYDEFLDHLPFEAPGIAYHCLQVYKTLGKNHFNKYQPENMLSMTNPFHNFVKDNYFKIKDGTTLQYAYEQYTDYCESSSLKRMARYKFRDHLKLYFDYYDDSLDEEGRAKNYFSGFKRDKIGIEPKKKEEPLPKSTSWLKFDCTDSLFDELYSEQPAQYPLDDGSGKLYSKWKNCTTKLKDLDTHKVHHVKVPEDLIVLDFDIKDESGNKSFEKNLEAASKLPPTYAELSKSGGGIHLHYIYKGGNPSDLNRVYGDNVEVKVFTGDSSLRRKLSKCNDLPIAELYSGLATKETAVKSADWDGYKNPNVLRSMIQKNTEKYYHSSTKSSIDYINDLLSMAYSSGVSYDLRDLSKLVLDFGSKSTNNKDYCKRLIRQMKFVSDDKFMEGDATKMLDWNQYEIERFLKEKISSYISDNDVKNAVDKISSLLDDAYRSNAEYNVSDLKAYVINTALCSDKSDYCLEAVNNMHFKSKSNEVEDKPIPENIETKQYSNAPIVIFDVESFPGDETHKALFIICWKFKGKDEVVKMINPSPKEVEALFGFRLIGFNNRSYDNHMIYAASQGETPEALNDRSKRLIANDKTARFGPAYNASFTDVLDFASAGNKMSLKKWEYKLKQAKHEETKWSWDKPVPEEYWDEVADYCANDVRVTEMVLDYLNPDYIAREILSNLSGLTMNDTTNSHTTQILVGDIKDPQLQYIYTDLSTIFHGYEFNADGIDPSRYIPGVKIVSGKSIYKGIDPGEGGRKIGYPGMYTNVGLFDVASMHPSSAIRLQIFGPTITKRFENIVKARIAIKHKDYDKAIELLGDKVKPYLTGDPEELKKNAKNLANALKTAINSVYGLTSAAFNNKLRDPRNVDNIVAKYGALFMIDLEEELTNMGYKVVHVSTDSIKVADVDERVANYIMEKGKEYGFTFEYEALYSKMCLVNDAVYIAKYASPEVCQGKLGFVPEDNEDNKDKPWTATGEQFAVPYVYKTMFSHEGIIFDDFCELFSVKEGAIYVDLNEGLEDPSDAEKELKKLKKKGEDPERIKELEDYISKCHNYQFVGRIGQFTPVLPGNSGGTLVRIKEGKAYAVQGTKKPDGTPYKWIESEVAEVLPNINSIVDRSYYINLVDKAIEAISQYGDYDWFVSDDTLPVDFINPPITDKDEIPFEEYVKSKE